MTRRDFLLAVTASPLLIDGFRFSLTPKKVGPASTSLDLSRLLECIALVETGGDDTKIGRSGELTRWQISKKVWIQHTPQFEHYTNNGWPGLVEPLFGKNGRGYWVATSHINWLHRHIGPNVFALALGWHVGLENWRAARFQLPQRYYGERVRNLYNDSTLPLT